MNALSHWMSSNGFMPHGFCYQWKPNLIWLHAISDTLIALAYFSIPIALVYFVRRRRDIPFGWMFLCFATFITACGATHVMDVWTLWIPSYWLSGMVKLMTVLTSIPTAIFLVRLMPTALSLPSVQQMKMANTLLEQQAVTLRASEERFRQIAENITEIFWTMNPATKELTYASPAFEQICEASLQALYLHPTSYRELIHSEDRDRIVAALGTLETTNRFEEEFRIVCPKGNVKWLRGSGFLARDSAAKPLAFVGTAQEITAHKKMEFALRESEDRYRDLVEHSTDLNCTYNLEGRLLSVNELPAALLGYTKEELLKTPMREFLPPEARSQFDESLLTIQRDGFVKGLMVVLTKAGEKRIWEYHNTLRTEGVSEPVIRGVAHDVTEQKRLEKALRQSEEKFAKAFHSCPAEITITTLREGRFLDVNEAFERNSGFTRDEIINRTSTELGLWPNSGERTVFLEQIAQNPSRKHRELEFRTKCGETRVKRYAAERIELGGEQCLLKVGEDVTDRKRAEENLRQLSGQLIRLQDTERRKIARDLHDSTGQNLAALATQLGQLESLTPLSARKPHALSTSCRKLAEQCVSEVRTLSYLLHPPLLDEVGLADAIRHFVNGFTKRSGIRVEFRVTPRMGRMPKDIELALFRVVQEGLTNVHRHSGSSRVQLQVERKSDYVTVEIKDFGRKVSAKNPLMSPNAPFEVGVGIPSMKERMNLIGGRFEIDSNNCGMTLRAGVSLGRSTTCADFAS